MAKAVKPLNTDWKKKKATDAALKKFSEGFEKDLGFGLISNDDYQVVSTGSLNIDYALTIGGMPTGRVIEVWGPEHAGKTTLCCLLVAEYQRLFPDQRCAWVDMEQCLRTYELVRLADGRRVPASELVGQQFTLHTSTEQGHVEVAASAKLMPGLSDIHRVTTESGRTLETNGKHPLYRGVKPIRVSRRGMDVKGWTSVRDLEVGDYVAVPTKTLWSCDPEGDLLSEDECSVLGFLVGDGSITVGASLTTPDGPEVDEFKRRIEAIGDEITEVEVGPTKCPAWGVRGQTKRPGGNHTINLLRKTGLFGLTSPQRFIPDQVFASKPEALAAFLGGLYAADGHVHVGRRSIKQANGLVRLELDTTSRQLAKDTQEALLRFGVTSTIRTKRKASAKTNSFPSDKDLLTVQVTQCQDIIRFVDQIPIPGKEEAQAKARDRAVQISSSKPTTWRFSGLNPDLRWERVDKIESLGQESTVGITVPSHHTYLSTFWEHNTFDPVWAAALGVDVKKLLRPPVKTAEDTADATKRLVESGLCSLVVLDSVGGMIAKMEFQKEADEATVGLVAKIVTRMVKQVSPMAKHNGTTVCVVNQVRASIGGYGADETTSGGWALKHVTTIRLQVKRAGQPHTITVGGKTVPVGHEMSIKVQKNKMGPYGQVAHVWLHNVETDKYGPIGVDVAQETFDFSKQMGLLGSKQGGYYMFPDETEVRGEPAAVSLMRERPDLRNILRGKVLASLAGAQRDESEDVPGEDEDDFTSAMMTEKES